MKDKLILIQEELEKVSGGNSNDDKAMQFKQIVDNASEEELIVLFRKQYDIYASTNNPIVKYILEVLKNKYNIDFKDDKLYKNGLPLY